MKIDIRQYGELIDGFKPGYHWCECGTGGGCCCPDTGDTPTPPTPDTGSTEISSITINVADIIIDSGNATSTFSPSTADTMIIYYSSDETLATIDQYTGEITVLQDGVVTFCVEDLISGLFDCKTVNVRVTPGPDTGDTGTTEYIMKVVYHRPAGDWSDVESLCLIFDNRCITKAVLDDGRVYENPGSKFYVSFETAGLKTVYYTVNSRTLNESLFFGLDWIIEVEIPEGITKIDDFCFSGIWGTDDYIPKVSFPSTIRELGESAFGACGFIKNNIVLPTGLKVIGEQCFAGCGMTSITIPNTVMNIGKEAFTDCTKLETAIINCSASVIEPARTGSKNIFTHCCSLKSFSGQNASVDHRMIILDNEAISFAQSGLTSYTVPSGVDTIGEYCFHTNTSLDDIYLSHIQVITIPEGVTTIKDYAFESVDDALTRINLPSTLEIIGKDAFMGRRSLTTIYSYAVSAPTVVSRTFYGGGSQWIGTNGVLHYPEGSDYSTWLSNNQYYLGYYGWTGQEINNI